MLRNLKIDEMFKDFEFILLSISSISFFILNMIFAQNISEDHSHHVRTSSQSSVDAIVAGLQTAELLKLLILLEE